MNEHVQELKAAAAQILRTAPQHRTISQAQRLASITRRLRFLATPVS